WPRGLRRGAVQNMPRSSWRGHVDASAVRHSRRVDHRDVEREAIGAESCALLYHDAQTPPRVTTPGERELREAGATQPLVEKPSQGLSGRRLERRLKVSGQRVRVLMLRV